MSTLAKVILSAEDRTGAAFRSATSGLEKLTSSSALAQKALGTLAAGFSVAAVSSYVKNLAASGQEIERLSAMVGTSAEQWQAEAYAVQRAGISQEKYADILKDVQDKVGDFLQTGAGPLADFFENIAPRVGVTAEQFRKLSGPEALQLYVNSLEKANLSQSEMTFFMEAIASDSTMLLPLLQDNGKAMNALAQEARVLGVVMGKDAVAAAKQLDDNLTRLEAAGSGLARYFAGPVIESLAQTSSYLIKVANDSGIAKAALITYGAAVARTLGLDDVGQLQSQARANQNAVALTVKQIETFQALANRGDAGAIERVARLRAQFDMLQKEGQRISSALKNEAASIESEFKPVQGTPLVRPVLPIVPRDPPPKSPPGGRSTSDPLGEFIKPRLERVDAMEREAARIYEQTRTPLEQLTKTEASLIELKEKGYLQDDAYWRAREQAQDQYDAQLDKTAEQVIASTEKSEEMAKRLGDAFAGTFDRAFTNGTKLGDLLKKLAYDALNIQFLTPAAQKFGSSLGSAVSSLFSFDGGGYTGSGSRAGGLDGKGGFMAVLHPNETVLDHTRGQGVGGGAIVINQSINIAGDATASTVAQLNATAARIKSEAVSAALSAVQAKANRGGSFAASMGRA